MGHVRVNAWASIGDGCCINCDVQDDNALFEFGNGPETFSFLMGRDTMARFVELATSALRQLDEPTPEGTAAPCGAGARE